MLLHRGGTNRQARAGDEGSFVGVGDLVGPRALHKVSTRIAMTMVWRCLLQPSFSARAYRAIIYRPKTTNGRTVLTNFVWHARLVVKTRLTFVLLWLLTTCFVQAENKNEAPQYDGTWRDADPADVKAQIDAGVSYTYRFKVPKGKVRQVVHLRRTVLYCWGERDKSASSAMFSEYGVGFERCNRVCTLPGRMQVG